MMGIGFSLVLAIIDVLPSVASTSPTTSIHAYVMGAMIPVKPIVLPPLSKSNHVGAILPVVRVPASYAVVVKPLASPKQVWADVPPNLANDLTAYFVQMDQTTSFYLIGLRGMNGMAELGADGTFDVYLKNATASIELDSTSGSILTAWSMAAPFFSSARKSLEQSGVGLSKSILHTTIRYSNPDTALFAFEDQRDQKVAGYDFYQPKWYASAFGGSAQMIYRTNNSGWKYAPWVLNAGIQALDNIGEPQIGGKVIRFGTTPKVTSGSIIPSGSAIKINQHIIWLQNSWFIQRLTSVPNSRFPMAPYSLMIGTYKNGKLIPNSERVFATIPWMKQYESVNQPLYDFPSLLRPTVGRYLPYIETWAGYGMNQPAINDLYVFDLNSGKNRLITPFPLYGGDFFAVGTFGDFLAYDKSGIVAAPTNFANNLWLVNLKIGRTTHLPTSDLHGQMVEITVNGQTIHIPLVEIG
jgi:hypothetical protein